MRMLFTVSYLIAIIISAIHMVTGFVAYRMESGDAIFGVWSLATYAVCTLMLISIVYKNQTRLSP